MNDEIIDDSELPQLIQICPKRSTSVEWYDKQQHNLTMLDQKSSESNCIKGLMTSS